jgi:hypothetical protein
MFICVTDGLDPNAASGLKALAARGYEIAMIQVLSDIERDPDLEGDLRLLDAETDAPVEVTAHSQTLREYKRNLEAHCATLEAALTRSGGRYLVSPPGEPIAQFVTYQLRKSGLAR